MLNPKKSWQKNDNYPHTLIKKIKSCGLEKESKPEETLVKELNSSIARNSNFVSISFKAESPQLAKECLEVTLQNIISNQNIIATRLIENPEVGMRTINDQLVSAKTEQKLFSIYNREKLADAKVNLENNKKFVSQFSNDGLTSNFSTAPPFLWSTEKRVALPTKLAGDNH
jgi:hypothetical protein